MVTAFYQTAAQLCFTVLGLWWLVLQTKYSEWIGNRARRRLATTISLYFLLPGSMSLIALLGADIPLLWRASFALASALGAAATLPVWSEQHSREAGVTSDVARRSISSNLILAGRWIGVALYLAELLVSLDSGIASFAQITPLLLAGIGLSLLIVLGVTLAWAFFLEPAPAKEAQ